MILQSLVSYYEALAEKGDIPRPGWVAVKISYALEIRDDGQLIRILPLKDTSKKHPIGREMWVPERERKSSDTTPNFLCDDKRYLLGCSEDAFIKTKEKHEEVLKDVGCKEAKAILSFFETWQAQKNKWTAEIEKQDAKDNIVFFVGNRYAQDVPEIGEAWERYYWNSEKTQQARCMITGEIDNICRIHPGFNIPGGTNPKLVSFDEKSVSFSSYGKDGQQGLNVPIGNIAAAKYGLALKRLLSSEDSSFRAGDMKIVFWAEGANAAYQNIFSEVLNADSTKITDSDLHSIVSAVWSGKAIDFGQASIVPENHFYILGLYASSKGRIGVRFCLQDRFDSILKNLEKHFRGLKIISNDSNNQTAIPLWALLRETVRYDDKKSLSKNLEQVLPQMAGDTLRAILTGGQYPATLYQQTQLRIRAEREVSRGRAAIIKAYLTRNTNNEQYKEALTVELNEKTTYQPYILGRMFSVLEDIQRKANPGINATIKDKYFTSACATPAVVFPTLLNLAEKHLRKMDTGARIFYSKQFGELASLMAESYPAHLTLNDQGIFQLGYYHQTQKRYEKKNAENIEEDK